MTFVDQVFGSQTTEGVLLPQLADSVDRFAHVSAGSSFFACNYLPGEHFFDIHFERHPSRLGLCRQPIGHVYLDLHESNFSMNEAVISDECRVASKIQRITGEGDHDYAGDM